MSAGVASKNLFDVLGNDVEDDTPVEVKEPRIIDKKATGTKRTGPAEVSTGAGRRGPGGNDGAFRDRNAGRDNNRSRPVTEDAEGAGRGGRGARLRGGRGSGNPRPFNDRHPRNRAPGSEKQAAQSWGATEGNAELKDEEAGEQIAQAEQKEALEVEGKADDAEAGEPAEPEPKQVTLDDFLAQRAEKKLGLETLQIRKANEGTKVDKSWASAKPIEKDEDDDFISASAVKSKRERERKVKQTIELDNTYHEPSRPTRGGPRNFAPRGDREGFRGDREGYRGDRENRGEGFRGGRGGNRGGERGNNRPRGGARDGAPPRAREAAPAINTADEQAFPSLGS
jgi:plasminogen activator inhibitor 1 RNA-binding protein